MEKVIISVGDTGRLAVQLLLAEAYGDACGKVFDRLIEGIPYDTFLSSLLSETFQSLMQRNFVS